VRHEGVLDARLVLKLDDVKVLENATRFLRLELKNLRDVQKSSVLRLRKVIKNVKPSLYSLGSSIHFAMFYVGKVVDLLPLS
jgi:hypothetical protein